MKSLKDAIELVLALTYAVALPFLHRKPRRVVIYYHSVSKQNVKHFEKQMAYLSKKIPVIKPSEIRKTGLENAKKSIVITFDDGLMSVLENAVPVLKKYGLPAGIFVPTGNLGKQPGWSAPFDCPDIKEEVIPQRCLAELEKAGFEILSHTVSHPDLTKVNDDDLRTELIQSKLFLEDTLGHEVCAVSYPYGIHNSRVRRAVRDCGYRFGFTIEPQIVNSSTDDLQIGRFGVDAKESLMKFRLKVAGAYQISGCLRTLKRRLLKFLKRERSEI